MNTEHEELESQLERIPLKPLSSRFRQRMAEAFASDIPAERSRRRILPGIVAVAASALIAWALWHILPSPTHPDAVPGDQRAEVEEIPPTIAGYHRALAAGPEVLDRLLDHHANTLLPPQRTVARVRDAKVSWDEQDNSEENVR
jgi:hypothetical protein